MMIEIINDKKNNLHSIHQKTERFSEFYSK